MTQTTNYHLNLWEPTDRILREDFNTDNAKMDEALKANADAIAAETEARQALAGAVAGKAEAAALTAETAARAAGDLYVRLADVTSEAAASNLSVSLSGHDLSVYQYLDVVADIEADSDVWMRINSGGSYSLPSGSTVQYCARARPDSSGPSQIRARIVGRAGNRLYCVSRSLGDSGLDEVVTYTAGSLANVTSLRFQMPSYTDSIPAGSHVTVYGMKR